MSSPYTRCVGKRDNISGCRDCCAGQYKCKTKYNKCVRGCMNNGKYTTLRKRSKKKSKKRSYKPRRRSVKVYNNTCILI